MSRSRPALVAEFVGTAALLLAIVGSGIAAGDVGSEGLHLFVHAIIVGFVLIGLVSAFGATSGAHFNPAVTVAEAALGGRRWQDVPPYVVVQVLGAVVGVVLANALFGVDALAVSDKTRSGMRLVSSEAIATLLLVVGIFVTVRVGQVRNIATVVGVTVATLIFATPSTALMNPAVTLSRMFTDTWTGIRPVDVLPFVLAQLGGALVAVVVVRVVSSSDDSASQA